MDVHLDNLKSMMVAQTQKTDVVANNLANVNTTGYKRDVAFFRFLEGSQQTVLRMHTDFTQGQIRQTENPLDLAISGPGFFAVETAQGEAYTRDGHFSVDRRGRLTTSDGNPVLGHGGAILLSLDGVKTGEVTVTERGEVYVNGEFVDRLKIVEIPHGGQVKKVGTNLFRINGNVVSDLIEEPKVYQGNLEASNVNPIEEMVNLIEIQRQFESSQRAVQTIDRAMERAANQLGRY
jgi:flagellar basal-body rod protein FlgG